MTAVVPDAAKPFLTLTPRDLAAGLSQAASAVIGMQDAEDGDLPLMRGSIGNAVDAVGGIKAFLADQVPDADPDDQTPGQPKFASLQDMLAALDSAAYADSGWSIDVLGGADAATFDADDQEGQLHRPHHARRRERPRAERPRRAHDRHAAPTPRPG